MNINLINLGTALVKNSLKDEGLIKKTQMSPVPVLKFEKSEFGSVKTSMQLCLAIEDSIGNTVEHL